MASCSTWGVVLVPGLVRQAHVGHARQAVAEGLGGHEAGLLLQGEHGPQRPGQLVALGPVPGFGALGQRFQGWVEEFARVEHGREIGRQPRLKREDAQ